MRFQAPRDKKLDKGLIKNGSYQLKVEGEGGRGGGMLNTEELLS